jgi:hypothetical protein
VIHSTGYSVQPPDGSLLQGQDGVIWARVRGVWFNELNYVYNTWEGVQRQHRALTLVRWGKPGRGPGNVLISDDPEPPDRSIVQDLSGYRWVRDSGRPAYWESVDDRSMPTQLWKGLSGLGANARGPVTVVYWGEELTTEKETTVSSKTPKDKKPATVEADVVRLLKLFASLDLAQLADSFSEFDDWSQDRVIECMKLSIRCVEEPSKVGQERSTREFKAAWSAFTDALKPLFDK